MSAAFIDWPSVALWVLQLGVVIAAGMTAAVIVERAAFACQAMHARRIEHRYNALVARALDGDDGARRALATSVVRHRVDIAGLLIRPLIDDRHPVRIARTRAILLAMDVVPTADRYLRSIWWWRRALALRVFGLVQMTDRTANIVAALDDPHSGVRAAALDALRNLRNPASLQAIVVRLQDPSLQRGRRVAALAAFGPQCESFLLDLARVDRGHRAHYARALWFCGTAQSRSLLCEWTRDARADVQAAAFETLARVGLDHAAAARAIAGLTHEEPAVRAMAASALRGWTGAGDAVSALARHLDDVWEVAVRAAQSLRSIRPRGLAELRAAQSRPGLPGVLARQMLWEERLRCRRMRSAS